MVELMVAGAVLVVAALSLVGSVATGQKLAVTVEDRGLAAETLQRFVERLRADPDWNGLYARLAPLSKESTGDTGLTWRRVDTTLAAVPLTTYYSDLVPPAKLGTVTALVQVPSTTVAGAADLRENAVAPRYGLPHDLNGDGVVDGNPRSADYRALPVVVRLRWRRPPFASQEIVLSTWLRGDR